MNFTRSHPRSKGHTVWRRNANTSDTNRRPANINPRKIRLTSQSSDFSCFPQSEYHLKINTTLGQPQKKNQQWQQLKSMAKYSTIASRMQLKKTVPASFLDMTQKKTNKKIKTNINIKDKSFSRVIDTNGNITKSFKQSSQFKSINPHIPRDIDKVKKKTFNLYQKQKKRMQSFLVQNDIEVKDNTSNKSNKNPRTKSLVMNYSKNEQMQRISQRQQYESRMNSTRMKGNNNKQTLKQNTNPQTQLKNQANKYIEDNKNNSNNRQRSSTTYNQTYSKKSTVPIYNDTASKKSGSMASTQQNNNLIKGLLGEYSNYEKLSKHQLIQKLISLEYLAQNIFKKNKYLQQQLDKKQQQFKEKQNSSVRNSNNINDNPVDYQSPIKNFNKKTNIFVINNADGYFNQFLQSQKHKQQQMIVDFQRQKQQPQRFRQTN